MSSMQYSKSNPTVSIRFADCTVLLAQGPLQHRLAAQGLEEGQTSALLGLVNLWELRGVDQFYAGSARPPRSKRPGGQQERFFVLGNSRLAPHFRQ